MYSHKIIVAPMVRVSTLPFRLLCLDYGADLVYTEEIIDFKMLRSVKIDNEIFGTTDFSDESDGTVFFRTCERERKKLIFQMGTCNSHRALKVAKLVENHVAGIDINMGCPKEFSMKGGMGAALLTQPDKVVEILTTLTSNIQVPITCKIRILPSLEDTVSLCKLIESCGVAAIAVHGRLREERPNHANHNDVIKTIAQSLSIPVIANGGSKEISTYEDIDRFRCETGASSVMIARAAMWNCSILRKEGKHPRDIVIKEFLKYCVQYDNTFTFSKYTVQNILRDLQSTDMGKAFLESQTLQEICTLWGLKGYFEERMENYNKSKAKFKKLNSRSCTPLSIENIPTTETNEDGTKVFDMPLHFIRGNYANADLPKMILNNYAFKKHFKKPCYTCDVVDKCFISGVELDGVKYRSSIREKSRRYAEQAAALVCLHVLGIVDKTYGFIPAEGTRKYFHQSSMLSNRNSPTRPEKREIENTEEEQIKERKSQKLFNTL